MGIDCSSTTIGWCVLEVDSNITFIDAGYVKPIKTGNIIERLVDTRNKFKLIIETHKPDSIAVENIIEFMQGKSTAKTIIMLTSFNRMICLLSYDFLNKSPELFNVMSIRHGLKLNKVFPKKEDMPELVAHHLGVTFPYEVSPVRKSSKPKIAKIKAENYDKADAIAVALYYAFLLTGKIKKKK